MIKHRTELPSLMKQLNLPMTAIELGVAEGYHANDLLTNGIELLYAVDLWATIPTARGDGANDKDWHDANYNAAKDRLKKHGKKVHFLRGLTSEMAEKIPDRSVGMVYLDSDHFYKGVMQDLICYHSKVVRGGIIAGHDFLSAHYEVKRAVEEFASIFDYEVHVIPENKNEDAGFWFVKN